MYNDSLLECEYNFKINTLLHLLDFDILQWLCTIIQPNEFVLAYCEQLVMFSQVMIT
jgi:hypothetical protein